MVLRRLLLVLWQARARPIVSRSSVRPPCWQLLLWCDPPLDRNPTCTKRWRHTIKTTKSWPTLDLHTITQQAPTASSAQLIRWVAQGGMQDKQVMQCVEAEASKHKELRGKRLTGAQLANLLGALSETRQPFSAYPSCVRLAHRCVLGAIPESEADTVCNLLKHSIALKLPDPDMLHAMVARLTSIRDDKTIFRWLSTFVSHVCSTTPALVLSEADWALLAPCIQHNLPRADNPIDLSKLMGALAKLGRVPLGLDVMAVVACFLEVERKWDAQAASNMLHSLAKLYECKAVGRLDNDVDWVSYGRSVQRLLPKFNAQALSNTLYALAKLKLQPASVLHLDMQQYGRAISDKLLKFNAQDLSNTLYALATLELQPASVLHLDMQQYGQVIADKLLTFNAQELSNTLYALAKLKLQPASVLHLDMQQYGRAISNKLPKFKAQELSNTLYALGLIHKDNQDIPMYTLAVVGRCAYACCTACIQSHTCCRLCQRADAMMDGSNAQNIANSLQGRADMRFRPPDKLVVSLMQRLADKLKSSTWLPMELSSGLLSCFKLACALPGDVLRCMLHALLEVQVGEQAVSNTLYAVCGLLCIQQDHAAMQQCLTQLRRLASRLATVNNVEAAQQLVQAHQACVAMGVDLLLPASLLRQCLDMVQQHPASTTVSDLQQRVVKTLEGLDVFKEVHMEQQVLMGTTCVDALCTSDDGSQLVVEADGPFHFFVNQPRLYNGSTRLKHMLLRHEGLTVVSVQYKDWGDCKNQAAREGLLQQLLLSAVQ